MKKLLMRTARRYWGVLVSLLVINILFSLLSDYYLTTFNLINMLNHSSIAIILSVGMVFVLATGGIDLSVGSTLAVSGIIAALLFDILPWPIAVMIASGAALGIGLANGLIITKFRLQPFIVTLAMLSIIRGSALVLSKGNPIIGMPEGFLNLFNGHRLLSNGIYLAALLALMAALILEFTAYGRHLRSVGASKDAAYVCAVRTDRVMMSAYMISSVLASLASCLFMASMDAAEPIAGLTTEWMEAIAAPIIGGNSMSGGKAYIIGAILGVLILTCIKSGLNMLGVGQHFQQIAIGAVIIGAVLIDSLRRNA